MSQDNASFTFLHRIEEVELNIEDGRWQSALALALTLPDICGGIAFPEIVKRYRDGRAVLDRNQRPTRDVGNQYIRWFDTYAAPFFKVSAQDISPYAQPSAWQSDIPASLSSPDDILHTLLGINSSFLALLIRLRCNNGQPVFQANHITESLHRQAGKKEVFEFPCGIQRCGIINDMVVNMGFVDVGRNDESVFALCPSHRCFIPDLVHFFRSDFSRLKGLAYLVCDDSSNDSRSACLRHKQACSNKTPPITCIYPCLWA